MTISVCMATRGTPHRLEAFLRSFAGVRLPVSCELIVVLNTPDPPDLSALPPLPTVSAFRQLVEPVPGKSRSLNRAIRAAKGELLVFTDDDVTFDPAWLERLWAAALRHPGIPVFGGAIRARGDVPRWIRRSVNLQGILLSEHALGESEAPYTNGRYPFGPNMAVRRAALERVGATWCESTGPGTRQPVGDEVAFLAQISPPRAGDRLYVPDAVVYHEVERSYFSLAIAVRRTFLNGLAAGRISARYGGVPQPRSVPAQIGERLARIASFQELVCNVSRTSGYVVGRYLSRS